MGARARDGFALGLRDERDTAALAFALADELAAGDVVLLSGELGAGKTSLTRELVRRLGGPVAATSPTFTLCHLYETVPPVAHVDCWRLETAADIADLDLDELLEAGYALVVEWGERARGVLGDEALAVELRLDPEASEVARTAVVEAGGGRWERGLGALRERCRAEGLAPADLVPGADDR